MSEELKACPFCGGEASRDGHIKYSHPVRDTWWPDDSPITEAFYVNCIKCGAISTSGFVSGYQTKAEAIAAWNTRAPDQRLEAENRQMREALEWRPIETAPKDGTIIILTTGDATGTGRWRQVASRDTLNDVSDGCITRAVFAPIYGWHSVSDKSLNKTPPTHWMPLPPFPTLASPPVQS